ncbi:N-acetylmuramoyl-L-alanine amidase [Aquibium sp. A9E412]|uniref:N-acetylmuramoyl-L-alanine amidase n=1 Tax=Aquibium sp. A9E412 TaxID=2976767 RepID=UPI0025B1B45F|nr:N-acetylmuramoyl-L-alanine amidase [Aquibium sp. A9E412]MDN2568516.1 N-acetylmuramoyl-L-alanine amidase [Aquibium sp. A9E412]
MFAAAATAGDVAPGAGEPLRAHGFKMAGDATHTRIVLRFDRAPEPRSFLLRDPHRVVIDLAETRFALDSAALAPRGLVSGVRYGDPTPGRSRLILSAVGPFAVERLEVLKNETSEGYRMIVDLAATSQAGFDAALRAGSGLADGGDAHAGAAAPGFTVVIDPGHGGIDGGAEGYAGTQEKTITLAFALELRRALEADGRYNVVMTRESDEFLRLDERVRIAREHDADLFISVHADAIRLRNVRGATVYTVADRASDAEAAATAARENLSDALAGIQVEEEKDEVADILVDLIRRETHAFSIRFARTLLGELSDSVDLIKNPHRFAGFRVLRAPDVPSVLLELGYLSNPDDEKQLRSAEWRADAVTAITDAIAGFAAVKAGAGG